MKKRKSDGNVIAIGIDRRVHKIDKPLNAKTTSRTVADPYSTTGGKIVVTASLRDDPLGRLHARRQITESQYATGHYVQNLFELAAIGSVQAMDPSKEFVDGRGQFIDPITEGQRRADKRLREARDALGARGYALVRSVLSERLFIEQIASSQGERSERGILFVGRRFRECLEDLSYVYGFAGRAPSKRSRRDEFTETAQHADNPELHKAIRRARELKEAT